MSDISYILHCEKKVCEGTLLKIFKDTSCSILMSIFCNYPPGKVISDTTLPDRYL